MKSRPDTGYGKPTLVTLSVRVWIEIPFWMFSRLSSRVTLSVRVWIEMIIIPFGNTKSGGHPQCEGVD